MVKVSVITSTCNRGRFMDRLITMYRQQTFPSSEMEWIVLDDGSDAVGPLFLPKVADLPNIRYIQCVDKLTMGAKLNILLQEAKGSIIVVMDDDDYYPPERVEHAVNALDLNPSINVVGCSLVYMYYTDLRQVMSAGPYHENHALNCTLAFRKSYCETHRYDDKETCAVESAFLNDYEEPMIQLDPYKAILHIIHSSNTFNAIKARNEGTLGLLKQTSLTLESFIQTAAMRLLFLDAY